MGTSEKKMKQGRSGRDQWLGEELYAERLDKVTF